jgi:hypothetical protein
VQQAGVQASADARKVTVYSHDGVLVVKLGAVDPASLTHEQLAGSIFHKAILPSAERADKIWSVQFWDTEKSSWSELVSDTQFGELTSVLRRAPAEVRPLRACRSRRLHGLLRSAAACGCCARRCRMLRHPHASWRPAARSRHHRRAAGCGRGGLQAPREQLSVRVRTR